MHDNHHGSSIGKLQCFINYFKASLHFLSFFIFHIKKSLSWPVASIDIDRPTSLSFFTKSCLFKITVSWRPFRKQMDAGVCRNEVQ